MLLSLIFALTISACVADVAVAPPVVCGETPRKIITCLGNPKIIKPEFLNNCGGLVNECERIKCVFRNAGWMKEEKVDKEKLVTYFDHFATESPEWSVAVQHSKATCLTHDLLPQGVHVNCPAYDIVQCSMASFIKNAQPSQWESSSDCQNVSRFAAACPLCPSACFEPLVPYGSCNACLSLPRSP